MKIVIIGSESFIGRELRKHCRHRSIDVAGIDMIAGDTGDSFRMDIRSPDIINAVPDGADALVHLAAVS